jgi:asparagine synthase (glutamine-hydrolysing)
MCGICGIVSRQPLTPEHLHQLDDVNAAMIHRGPDGAGEFHNTHVALAMRRLSIIDLSGGWQPLYSEDRSLVLVANGEIYNFVELRAQLEAQGHRFRTGSDCETIIHAYEEHGPKCVEYLRGMFAFALWDGRRRRLLLVRDRMGEKPLYLWEEDEMVIFASELKALVKAVPYNPKLDPSSVDLYFHFGYVPEPLTPLAGIRKLPAGHILLVEIEPWSKDPRKYWDMVDAPPLEGDPVKAIRTELDTISSLVIRSDVPVGIALSGGLDSSAIAALAGEKYRGRFHAFSIGYPGSLSNDERNDAKALADYLGMPFHDVELSTSELVEIFPDLVYHADDPIPDIAAFGYYALSRLAREYGVPVLLQGQGGDELFWGYSWVREATIDTLHKQELGSSLVSGWQKLMIAAAYYLPKPPQSVSPRRWMAWLHAFGGDPFARRMERWCRVNDNHEKTMVFMDSRPDFQIAQRWKQSGLYGEDFQEELDERHPYDLFTLPPPWGNIPAAMTRLISQTYLLENGIAQGERLGMASSVELRLPLVDHRLVEIVIGYRKNVSDHKLPPKTWLRQGVKPILPDWVLKRPKRGFAPPVREWYDALHRAYGRALEDGCLVERGVLNRDAAGRLASGEGLTQGIKVMPYKALHLEFWCRRYLGT